MCSICVCFYLLAIYIYIIVGCVVHSAVGLSCAGDPQRLAHHQHQYHEGRIQGLLVCPDC